MSQIPNQILSINQFLAAPGLILDVRSPGEYQQGHIPEAVSFPLFNDQERSQVGTCYKHQGKEQAVELGLAIAGVKLVDFVTEAKRLAPSRQVRVHCWRGGMRSGSMGWLLETAGMQVCLLNGGYKSFRHWVLATLAIPKQVIVLGGMTGTGKTKILTALAEQGEQTLDLEQLANHRGSTYGSLGLPPQPTNEHFENLIALEWASIDPVRPVWIEAESKRIGSCQVPDRIFKQMLAAPVLQIERSRRERIDLLLEIYGTSDREQLIKATANISKRLGGLRTQQAITGIREGNLAAAIDIVLDYYDKTYSYDLLRRQAKVYPVDVRGCSLVKSIDLLIQKSKGIYLNQEAVASSRIEPQNSLAHFI